MNIYCVKQFPGTAELQLGSSAYSAQGPQEGAQAGVELHTRVVALLRTVLIARGPLGTRRWSAEEPATLVLRMTPALRLFYGPYPKL